MTAASCGVATVAQAVLRAVKARRSLGTWAGSRRGGRRRGGGFFVEAHDDGEVLGAGGEEAVPHPAALFFGGDAEDVFVDDKQVEDVVGKNVAGEAILLGEGDEVGDDGGRQDAPLPRPGCEVEEFADDGVGEEAAEDDEFVEVAYFGVHKITPYRYCLY
jgi:hypothetical protein